MRNIEKRVNNGLELIKKRPRLALTASELTRLYDPNRSDKEQGVFDAICFAFYLGVSVGAQIIREERKE